MKKSEMVNEIAKVIAGFKGSTEPTRNDMYVASSVLNTIEGLGMKPPSNPTLNGNDFEAIRDTFRWEPEND